MTGLSIEERKTRLRELENALQRLDNVWPLQHGAVIGWPIEAMAALAEIDLMRLRLRVQYKQHKQGAAQPRNKA